MQEICFTPITQAHIQPALEIYLHYVHHSTATFHCRDLNLQEMAHLLMYDDSRFGAFAIMDGEHMCGYVLAHPFSDREAYHNTTEIGLYLHPDYTGKGLGSKALAFIEDFTRKNGFHVLLSLISSENEPSMRLFERHGYTLYGRMREAGFKFGRYLDVVEYQKILD